MYASISFSLSFRHEPLCINSFSRRSSHATLYSVTQPTTTTFGHFLSQAATGAAATAPLPKLPTPVTATSATASARIAGMEITHWCKFMLLKSVYSIYIILTYIDVHIFIQYIYIYIYIYLLEPFTIQNPFSKSDFLF